MRSRKNIDLPCLSPRLRTVRQNNKYEEVHLFKSKTKGPGNLISLTNSPRFAKTRSEFFRTLKYIPNSSRKDLIPDNPTQIFLKECQAKCLNPLPIGLSSETSKEVNIANYSMGDNYAQAFAKSLHSLQDLEKLNISSTSLSPKGTCSIITNISNQPIKELSLKDNQISFKIIQPLIELISKPFPTLKYLNLENTKISDRIVCHLCEVLANDNVLAFLGLAKNSLGYISCVPIRNLLQENENLKQLDLHWNNIKDIGAAIIFEGLVKNDSLKELDLSWNSIGKNKENKEIKTIAKRIGELTGLIHLDLSCNFLTANECELIGKELNKNHSILGIHVVGNQTTIDSQGFFHADPKINLTVQTNLLSRLFRNDRTYKRENSSMCWLCESWKETIFYWEIRDEKILKKKKIYLHLECDDFLPSLMVKTGNTAMITRVIPSNDIRFFYSIDGNSMLSNDYQKIELDTPLVKSIGMFEEEAVTFRLAELNFCEVKGKVFSKKTPFNTEPRPAPFEPISNMKFKRVNWSISNSIFKDYGYLNQELASDCFEFDWKESKLNSWVRSIPDKESLKKLLKSNYILIISIFRDLACQSANGLLTIGNNVVFEFLSQLQVFDAKFTIADLGVNWNTVSSTKNKQPFNPGNSLVRYEFMELLVRISHDKFIRSKVCNSFTSAFSKFLNESLQCFTLKYFDDNWRFEYYAIEDVEIVIKTHLAVLKNIYQRYSGKKTPPGQKPFMCFEEFRNICSEAGLLLGGVNEREVDVIFCMSMMIQVDEVYKKRHIEMNFLEFVEAFCRVCWRMPDVEVDATEDYWDEPGLPKKIEKAVGRLLRLCHRTVRESFVAPTIELYKSHKFVKQRTIRAKID